MLFSYRKPYIKMKSEHKQNVTEFSIQGLTDIPEFQIPIFLLFLISYIVVLLANMAIIVVILSDSQLHTPMYILLLNLSLTDIVNVSDILPKVLNILLTRHKTVYLVGCITQMYIFVSLTLIEMLILSAMAYDRYVAICHPLHYFIFMSLRHTLAFAVASWTIGFLDPTGHAVLMSRLSFCKSHLIDHFFCDVTPLLKISCSDTFKIEMLTYVEGTLIDIPAFLLTFFSYVFIVSSILKIQTSEGRKKAFSTCTSHLTCVTLFYVTLISLYMRPTSSLSLKNNKFFSLIYVVLIPMLNPVIYTLKNHDVKEALKKLMNKKVFFRAH
ncbi:olfactory receptor 1019-like [Spea bombifrons]|uniref:olfactory receptor 1019-like n=1 Tax=Spea bombifrons TaxID=233779 RepID=UPI00234AFFF2|nr:olfactory receptor 1019-like [Spea bombifrons]